MAQLLYLLVLSHRFLSLWPLENIVIYLSVSFIQQTIFEYLLSVRLLIVMQLFPVFFFFYSKNVACCEDSCAGVLGHMCQAFSMAIAHT